ncbi:MAG: hypothetical protein IPM64_11330 [Phycisphaerales bacterium]|nr:hypothetical protein [Phycisphaerales bacterium]
MLGVDRGTVARYVQAARAVEQNQPNLPTGPPDDQDQPNPPTGSGGASGGQNQPNPPAGSGPASRCAPLREVIGAWLERGLSAQRIWQDLKAEHAFSGGYDSVKRFCRRLQGSAAPPFRRMECAAGEEAQVDFGRGAPVLAPAEPGLKGDASSGSRAAGATAARTYCGWC